MPKVWRSVNTTNDWFPVDKVIATWLKDRDTVVRILFKLAGITELEAEETAEALTHQFCELVTDYVCVLQLEILNKIYEAECLHNKRQSILDRHIIENIITTTNPILEILDLLLDTKSSPGKITKKLDELGNILSHRLQYEDKLINIYLEVRDSA